MIMKRMHSKSFFIIRRYWDNIDYLFGENPKHGDDDVIVLQIQMLAEEVFLLEIVKRDDYEFSNPPIANEEFNHCCVSKQDAQKEFNRAYLD